MNVNLTLCLLFSCAANMLLIIWLVQKSSNHRACKATLHRVRGERDAARWEARLNTLPVVEACRPRKAEISA